jgi:arylformamidase
MTFLDLTHQLHSAIPVAPILPPVSFERVMKLEDGQPNVMMCSMPSHCGTHVDAPSHFIQGGLTIEEVPLEWLIGRSSTVSLELEPRQAITAAMLETAGGHVQAGDRLFLDTGFSARYQTPEYVEHPYLDASAADWIVERGVRLLALDCLTPDKPHSLRDAGFDFPVHHRLLGEDVIIVENVRLDPRPPDVFEVSILPLPLRAGDGAPARIVARV